MNDLSFVKFDINNLNIAFACVEKYSVCVTKFDATAEIIGELHKPYFRMHFDKSLDVIFQKRKVYGCLWSSEIFHDPALPTNTIRLSGEKRSEDNGMFQKPKIVSATFTFTTID